MSYSILQHRRGTSQEWLDVDAELIPLQGELIIEELKNGLCKCKIGNGRSRFSELPYITDTLKEKLLLEITELDKKLQEIFKADIDSAKQNLILADKTLEEKLQAEINNLSDDVTTFTKNLLDSAKDYTDSQTLPIAETLENLITKDLEAIKETIKINSSLLENEVKPTFDTLDKKIDSSKAEVEQTLENKISLNQEELLNSLSLSEKSLDKKIAGLNQKIADLVLYNETVVRPEISNLTLNVNSELSSLENTLNIGLKITSENFNKDLAETKTQLVENITELKNNLEAFKASFDQQQEETSRVLDEITEQITTISKEYLDQLELIFAARNYCIIETTLLRNELSEEKKNFALLISELSQRVDTLEEKI